MMWFFLLKALAGPASWEHTITSVVESVAAITVTHTRDFDNDMAGTGQGTAFVVDAERGILLTNRHLLSDGPVVAEAVFSSGELVELVPLYRDPVHDFAFYKFDPDELRHLELHALPLVPQAAKQGLPVRVIGNNAGEQISILDGTLARLDRNAPIYGQDSYNDFNTFYYQAASNTSGGSSGSPVVDIEGQVVALNAGGADMAASSFFFPLHRVVHALTQIQKTMDEGVEPTVQRGTLQAIFAYKPFEKLVRLGLTQAQDEQLRQVSATGAMVVSEVIVGGSAEGKLEVGDILISINNELAADFVTVESVLDASVSKKVQVQIQRADHTLFFDLQVSDLHTMTPSNYLEVGRSILHELSYHTARNNHIPVKGVYLASAGYMWSRADIPDQVVITHLNGVQVNTLDEVTSQLKAMADHERFRVRFHPVIDEDQVFEKVVELDRAWHPMRRCQRQDGVSHWSCTTFEAPELKEAAPIVGSALYSSPPSKKPGAVLHNSLVLVEFDIPFPTSGVRDLNYIGVGIVVDEERGWVLVDRDTVPVAVGDLTITVNSSARMPASLIFVHPSHNFALLKYDVEAAAALELSEVQWATKVPDIDDPLYQVVLSRDREVLSKRLVLNDKIGLELGSSHTPRFRESNVLVWKVDEAEDSLGGVLCDKKGRVYAQWASFFDQDGGERRFYGLPASYLLPHLNTLEPTVRVPGFEVAAISVVEAQQRGVPTAVLQRLREEAVSFEGVYEVRRIHGQTTPKGALQPTDLVVSVNGSPMSNIKLLEMEGKEPMSLEVIRDGELKAVTLDPLLVSSRGVVKVLNWAGLILHDPHFDLEQQRGEVGDGVYVSWLWYGSPAAHYGLRPTRRIVAIDGQPTPNLQTLERLISTGKDGDEVRVDMVRIDGRPRVETLKLDLNGWPTYTLIRDEQGRWSTKAVEQIDE